MNWQEIKIFFASLTLQKLVPAILILVVGIILVKLLLKLFDRGLARSKLDRTMFSFIRTVMRIKENIVRSMFSFIRTVMRVLLYSLLVLIAASSLGIDVSSLVALVSVVSLAISLAVQNALSNVVGSISLLATHPFHVGDYIEIGSDAGTVEEITMSYTKIATPDGKRIYIPNSDAASARICNYSAEGKRRIDLYMTASYADATEKVKSAILTAASRVERLEGTEPVVYLSEFLDSSVQYYLQLWVKSENYFAVKFVLNEEIRREFDAQGITIPFPQLEVRVEK